MKKGGYQIIDLQGKSFNAEASYVYEGIYDLIEGTTKPIYISGFILNNVEQRDCYAEVHLQGTSFICTVKAKDGNKYTIIVADNDVVSINIAN